MTKKTTRRAAFVYLLRCADGTIYTGWTFDVTRRVQAHQDGRGARYTRTRRPVELIYRERLPSRRAAMRREIEIKKMSRARKLRIANCVPYAICHLLKENCEHCPSERIRSADQSG